MLMMVTSGIGTKGCSPGTSCRIMPNISNGSLDNWCCKVSSSVYSTSTLFEHNM